MTLHETTLLSPTQAESQRAIPRRNPELGGESPSELTDWDALRPTHAYVRLGQPLLNWALLAVFGVPALALGCVIGLANLFQFRDPRRVFFVQERLGQRGRVFRLIKFRTMREVGNFESWSGGERLQVTALGRLLRNTHLDELPQMINVALGDMNFIGPRPEMLAVESWAAEHVPGFSRRLALKPGLTGEAQITQGYTGFDVEAYSEKLAINERYMQSVSFGKDLSILLRTAVWMVRGRGWWPSGKRA